ncbi:MAG: hypothetical protein KHX58_07315, partial [Coprobacillus sp.]|nr:hypothetical protein [Coprobacillus sp.]
MFASHLYPEIFGYVGDVLFPSIILSQIVEMIDSNILFDKSMDCNQKSSLVFEVLSKSISNYPINCMSDSMKIIYVFLTIFLYLLKCPQSLILSALRAFCL